MQSNTVNVTVAGSISSKFSQPSPQPASFYAWASVGSPLASLISQYQSLSCQCLPDLPSFHFNTCILLELLLYITKHPQKSIWSMGYQKPKASICQTLPRWFKDKFSLTKNRSSSKLGRVFFRSKALTASSWVPADAIFQICSWSNLNPNQASCCQVTLSRACSFLARVLITIIKLCAQI